MTRMFRFACAAVLALGLFGGSALVAQEQQPAQDQNQGQGQGRGMGRGHGEMMNPQQRADRMAKMLNLSDEQKTKLTDILTQQQKQMTDLRNDTSTSEQDKRAKMKDIHQWSVAQIRGILNADQQKKFDQMEERMANRRKGAQGGEQPKQQ